MTREEIELVRDLKRIQDEDVFVAKFEEALRVFQGNTRKRVPAKVWGRYQNIIWRDRHEEWEHDGHRYMSGDNFRSKDDWYAVDAHEEDKPYSKHWYTPYSFRYVYFRGGVYKSVDFPRYEKQIFLYSIYRGHGFLMSVTSCAPVIKL